MGPEQLRARWNAMLPDNYELRDSEALFDVLAPVIRADILAFESCAGLDIKLNRTPLLGVGGEIDQMVPAATVRAWADCAASAEFVTVDGGHLFVLSHEKILAAHIESFVKKQRFLPTIKIASYDQDWCKPHRLSIHSLPTSSGGDIRLPELSRSVGATTTSAADFMRIGPARTHLLGLLLEYGVILFRGFGVVTAEMVSEVMAALGDVALDYVGGNSPRVKLGNGVYTSTEYPADQEISPHAELCYESTWPARLYFACSQPAASGGATPLVDLRRVLSRLQPRVVDQFLERGLLYIRRLHAGHGLGCSWSSTFDTDDPKKVEKILLHRGAIFEWQPEGMLLLKQKGPVVHRHPVTGDEVWFNQAEQWHPSTLPSVIREVVGTDFPHDVCFADNTPINSADVCHIREVLWAEAGQFRWERGDLLVVDNERMAHGRRSFEGPRRVLVSMGVAGTRQRATAAESSAFSQGNRACLGPYLA
jgi:alpha-ketoglutarate-dependent taurine dioxygenase